MFLLTLMIRRPTLMTAVRRSNYLHDIGFLTDYSYSEEFGVPIHKSSAFGIKWPFINGMPPTK